MNFKAFQPLHQGAFASAVSLDPADRGPYRIDVSKLIHALIRRKWIVAAAIISALSLGVALTLLTTPVYRAVTTLQIEREAVQVVERGNLVPEEQLYNSQEFYQTQYGLLRSRSLALRVVRELNLASHPGFSAEELSQKPLTPSIRVRREREAVETLIANLRVDPVLNSRLVEVSYESPNPALAAKVADAIASNFIAANLERRFESSSYARSFLEGRLQQLRSRLEAAERELVEYAQREQLINVPVNNADQSGGEGRPLVTSRLVEINNALSAATTARSQAEQRLRAAGTSTRTGLPEALADPTMQALQQRRDQLAAEYQKNLQIYQSEYPLVRQLKAQIDETDRQIAAETRAVRASLQAQYQAAAAHERELQAEVSGLRAAVMDIGRRSVGYNILRREVDTSRSLYEGLLQRYREIGIAGAVGANNISVVDRAEVPNSPIKPQPLLNLLLALISGIGLGLFLALLMEYLDNSIRVPADVEGRLGLPLLGTIPNLGKGQTPETALQDARSGFSEAYHSARSALQFSSREGLPKSLLVTSSRESEGKTTSAIALARDFSRLGTRVLLVEGDLRDPSLHRELRIPNSRGIVNFLTGSTQLDELVQRSSEDGLSVLSCGPLPPNPGELLGTPRLQELVAQAVEAYDLVIVDGPPVMGLADAPLWSSATAGTLFVVAAGSTKRTLVAASLARVQRSGGQILGVLLSKFSSKSLGYGDSYAYGYAYGAASTTK